MLCANIFMKKFIFLFAFNVYKGINIFILQMFSFINNSLISVMPYKAYNKPQEVCNGAKSLISVIYYNVYNMMEWKHRNGRKWHTGVILHPCQHGGTGTGTKWHACVILHPCQHGGTRTKKTVCNFLQTGNG